jgi:hypothetical protein
VSTVYTFAIDVDAIVALDVYAHIAKDSHGTSRWTLSSLRPLSRTSRQVSTRPGKSGDESPRSQGALHLAGPQRRHWCREVRTPQVTPSSCTGVHGSPPHQIFYPNSYPARPSRGPADATSLMEEAFQSGERPGCGPTFQAGHAVSITVARSFGASGFGLAAVQPLQLMI